MYNDELQFEHDFIKSLQENGWTDGVLKNPTEKDLLNNWSKILFENVTFNINKGERIGLVGRNGNGKTTLMRIITGEEEADSGKVSIPKNYKIGFLKQHIKFEKNAVIEEAMLGLSDEEIHDKWKAEKILFGLGFKEEDMEKAPSSFSGGFQVRLMLAQTLLSTFLMPHCHGHPCPGSL